MAKKVLLFTLIMIAWMAIQARLRPVSCGPCMMLNASDLSIEGSDTAMP